MDRKDEPETKARDHPFGPARRSVDSEGAQAHNRRAGNPRAEAHFVESRKWNIQGVKNRKIPKAKVNE